MKALDLDKLDAFMEIEYDGEIYNAHTENDIDDKAINVIPIPDNATNGDMIKAMFQVVGYTPLSIWTEEKRKKSGFHVHVQGEFKTDFRLTVSDDWWDAPYKKEVE